MFLLLGSAILIPHSSFHVPHSHIPQSSFLTNSSSQIPHSTFPIPHSTFPIPCSPIPHSTFLYQSDKHGKLEYYCLLVIPSLIPKMHFLESSWNGVNIFCLTNTELFSELVAQYTHNTSMVIMSVLVAVLLSV